MTDFDFDELDRAVNGALSSDAPSDTSSEETTVKQTAPQESLSAESESSSAEPVIVDKDPSTPVIRRSSGRFMDVVHPSSDMRSRPATVGDALAASHVAPPIEPKPIVNRPTKTILQSEDSSSDTPSAWQTPLESPFLPDAKVEKRPLGGSEPTGPSIGNEVIDKEKTNKLVDDELKLEAGDEPLLEAATMPDPIDFAAAHYEEEPPKEDAEPAVAEPSVAEVEAVAFEVVPEEVTTKESETPVELTKEDELSYHEAEPATSASTFSAPAEEVTGPTSITPQYKEQPSSSHASGAIYDTESYHQPLAHSAKKRSGALVILWVVLLVGLGAAAGAAFYLYVLPHV